MDKIFFDTWESFLRTFIIGILAYTGLVLMLRISGNRTLSRLNAFDFIVTVALGSTLATVLLNKNIALVDGLLGFAMLIGLQFGITWLSARYKSVRKLIKTEPFLLFYNGDFLKETMRIQRVTEDEVLQTIRSEGFSDLNEIDAIVLETNGKFSVIKKSGKKENTSLKNVVEH